MARKPLLFDTELSVPTERALQTEEMARAADNPNYIPGYTENEVAQSLAQAEYGSMAYQQREHQFRRLGIDQVRENPIHIKPVRVSGLDGRMNENVLLDQMQYRKDGYRPMTRADLEAHGIAMPPLYHEAPDGTIRRGDVALWFVDAQRAKEIRANKIALTKERETGAVETVGNETGVQIDIEVSRDPNFSL